MSTTTLTYWALVSVFVLALVVHVTLLGGGVGSIAQQDEYGYDQSLEITGVLGDVRLTMYVPAPAEAIEIRDERFETADLSLELAETAHGRRLILQGRPDSAGRQIRYRARVRSRPVEYRVDPALPWELAAAADSVHLAATATIQTRDDLVADRLAAIFDTDGPGDVRAWETDDWQSALARRGFGPLRAVAAIYDHCLNDIRPASFSGTTDALTALRLGESSCGGKSRLMTTLCRRLGLPARIIGGVILGQPGRRRAHHLWVEVKLGGTWVPFDPLNDYFAFRPGKFLPLYQGDRPLIRHSRGLTFDYGFASVRHSVPLIWLGDRRLNSDEDDTARLRVIPLLERQNFSAILLAPFALLLIVFARQIVGIESIGIFLPILMGYSLIQADLLVVGIQMVLAIAMGVLARFLLTRLNLLHVPRTAVMITLLVLVFLAFSAGVARFDSFGDVGAVVLPLAALAMAVERFTIVAMDRGTRPALGLLLQTILLALGCRAILVTPFFQILTVAFPEVLVLVIAMIILVGNYRGLRWREHWRFRLLRHREAS